MRRASPTELPAGRRSACGVPQRACLAALALALGGCAARLDVRSLATGRSDVSAYELNGSDLDALRREAQRLCPLGGEILRQASWQQQPQATGGRWRQALDAATAWTEAPRGAAQLLVQCREGGERGRLQVAAPAVAAPAVTTLSTLSTLSTPAVPAPAAAAAPTAGTRPARDLSAALPVGPITPQW
jgi:hypothetical protein